MKLLVLCTIAALCVFVQVARAQEEETEAAAPAPAKENIKQEDEEAALESRGGSYGDRGQRGGREHNSGGLRGGAGQGFGGGGGAGAGGRGRAVVQSFRVTNKHVQGYTRVLPTVHTRSRERHDVRSQSNSYYKQNSASTITQNNKRKQTFIHTHLNQLFYHPRHVNHIHKHHHTTFVKQLFPEVTKINIQQKQKIIEPEKLTIIKYTQDSSFKNRVYPVKIHRAQKYEQLKTIREPVRNLGVRNIGSPLGYVETLRGFNGFESGNKFVGGGNRGGFDGAGSAYGRKNERLYRRAGEAQEEVAPKTEEAAAAAPEVKEEVPVAETKE